MAQSVGDRLAQCRRVLSVILDRDIKQEEMAEIIGFGPAIISHWETGRRRPSRDAVAQIVDRLHAYGMDWLTPAYLEYGVGDGPPAIGKLPERPLRDAKPAERLERSGQKPKKKVAGKRSR